jgi:hypothetical protein
MISLSGSSAATLGSLAIGSPLSDAEQAAPYCGLLLLGQVDDVAASQRLARPALGVLLAEHNVAEH